MVTPSIPKQMKAWVVTKNGPPSDALTLRTDYPTPAPPKGSNIMVKVSYAALNPADVHFMLHLSNWIPFRHNPHPGLDFVGTVVQAGPSAELEVGAEVGGAVNVSSVAFGKGSLAEYIVIPSDIVARRPKSLEMRQAAGALGVAGQTTALVLGEANVKAGDKVLVNGASGGVGSVLVQIVKGLGATVYGVCSEANADMVKRLGADHVSLL